MSKIDDYRLVLRGHTDWDPYLLEHSGLPGPRGNIELGRAAALAPQRQVSFRERTEASDWIVKSRFTFSIFA
jgi:hypothetical protein